MGFRVRVPAYFLAVTVLSFPALAEPAIEVVPKSKLTFQPLNPARGDASPKAGVLWGDIKKNVPSGVLLRFADGFSSPPHLHNITYRAVVISGAVHNDDANAEKMWMGPGSFWTQPAGESHITAASKGGATAFLEILEGPYLVQPSKMAFDNGERPVNLDARNVVWLSPSDVTWIDAPKNAGNAGTAKIAFLWGSLADGKKNGTFIKMPAKFKAKLRGNKSWLRAVVIQGTTSHQVAGMSDIVGLEPGSYFGSKGDAAHQIACTSGDQCVLYVHTEGKYQVSAR